MAILCGTLAWLEHQKKLKRLEAQRNLLLKETPTSIPFITDGPPSPTHIDFTPNSLNSLKSNGGLVGGGGGGGGTASEHMERLLQEEIKKLPKAPKIFITSRTHKQIAQLVNEMHRTSYRPSFVVLGSRKHYCINQKVLSDVKREKKDLNEACKDLNRGKGANGSGDSLPCRFFKPVQDITKGGRPFPPPNKDIEDFVQEGEDESFCPYFGAMASIPDCEVIFAPYNYIIDPTIWKSMKLDGIGECVVIVDEAHNIEDVCRDSASFEITDEQLATVQRELSLLIPDLRKPASGIDESVIKAHESQGHILAILNNWLRNSSSQNLRSSSQRRDFDSSTMIWNGNEIPIELDSIGLRPSTISALLLDLDKITQHSETVLKGEKNINTSLDISATKKAFHISFGSLQILERLLDSLNSLFNNDKKDITSFSLVKYESITGGGGGGGAGKKAIISLGFWCWNPAIMFSKLTIKSKSVILTSGTLSPMDTFSSELDCSFDNRLEALHIIDDDQVLITCLPRGPSNTALIGNFHTMDSLAFQDDISNGLKDICEIVPGGVVCFVPSYSFMEKLKKRMIDIGVMGKIESIKKVFTEPRQGSPKEFEEFLSSYYRAIQQTGALLFAVYRGKISEGLDLKDANCRAVVPIGIPYPAFKDPKVILKREYNDRKRDNSLTGQQWYESQAFRALNQALGRCIRHRKDWGAILLLEQRFSSSRNTQHLSKWVRGRLSKEFGNLDKSWKDGMADLVKFVNCNETKDLQNKTINDCTVSGSISCCAKNDFSNEKFYHDSNSNVNDTSDTDLECIELNEEEYSQEIIK